MTEREVTDKEVRFALAYGRRSDESGGTVSARTKNIRVVYHLQGRKAVIITVMRNEHSLFSEDWMDGDQRS